MKKISVIILVVLVAALLGAASPTPKPVPPPAQSLSGMLSYSHSNICMIRDFIALPVMENVYLIGKGFPTQGQYQGCRIDAAGSYISFGVCKVFQATSTRISCPQNLPVPFPTPSHASPSISNH